MTAEASTDWYTEARRRAVAAGRRRRAATASAEWPEFAPAVPLSDGPLGEVQAADREIARQTGRRARAVARFAASRPAGHDRAQGEPGAMSAERWASRPPSLRTVSEWAGRELMVALSIGAPAADALLTRSLDLVHRLPGTLAALEAGALHPGHLWTMLDKVAPIEDATIRAEVEAELLRWAAGRVVTPAQLNDKARREVARRDVRAAARRLEKALKKRGVHLRPHEEDGMATLTVVATMPEAQALHRALAACVDTLDGDDDLRTRGQKMVDCLIDLVLRPGESDLPPVQVLLTVVASIATLAGGDDPGELDGHVVPAEMVRQFLAALTGVALPTADDLDEPLPDRSVDPVPWQEREQRELESWWAEMERRVLSGDLVDPDPARWPPCSGEPDHLLPLDGDVRSDDAWSDSAPAWSDSAAARPDSAAAWPDSGAARPDDAWTDDAWTDDAWTDDAAPPGCTEDHDGPHLPSGSDLAEEPQLSDESGWWATADRAVEQAEQAMAQACRALARAERAVRTAAAADTAEEDAWQAGHGGRVTRAADSLAALRAADDAQRERIVDLLSTTGGGGLAERPRIALTHALSGALVALTDLPGLRRAGSCGETACRRCQTCCPHDLSHRPTLGPPAPTDGYRPSAALDRFMRARDRRCRFPGCRRRIPRGGELDHGRPYPSGPTSAGNLVGYCTTDHRGKHQAPGWAHELRADGTLVVTTPTGLVATTTPPPY